LDGTGGDLAKAAFKHLNLPYNSEVYPLLRSPNGAQRWLSLFTPLRAQGVQANEMVLMVISTSLPQFRMSSADFETIKVLGAGKYGAVSAARIKSTNETVALKEMTSGPTDPDFILSFKREVEVLATAGHPALLTLRGIISPDPESTDSPSIITPYMSQGSLDLVLQQARSGDPPSEWTITRKLIVLLGIAAGMEFMHRRRFIHRDLKPENVLLDDRFEPCIADFGFSKIESQRSSEQTRALGTPLFQAPEIFEHPKAYNSKVDVYAFGITMYMVITNQPASDARDLPELTQKVQDGERPEIPEETPEAFTNLIRACWAQDPSERPDFAEVCFRLGTDEFLQGVDRDVFDEYQARVCPPALIARGEPWVTGTSLYARMAATGDPFAQVQFGKQLQTRNLARAADFFRAAAAANNTHGLVEYGRCLYQGIGVGKDPAAAADYFRRAAVRGNPEASYMLGRMVKYGEGGLVRNPAEGLGLIKAAADRRFTAAANFYGEILEAGDGVRVDLPEALRYYKLAEDLRFAEGFANLADMDRHGRAVPLNRWEALRLYVDAANSGSSGAKHALFEIYRDGEADEIFGDSEEAERWAREHAETKAFLGLVDYAEALIEGIGVHAHDERERELQVERGRELRAEAHSAAFADDQVNYSWCLAEGKRCRQDLGKAVEYARIAAGNGSGYGALRLGIHLWNAWGVERDLDAAVASFKRAVDLGYDAALWYYAQALVLGLGIGQNYAEGIHWLEIAAEKKDPQSICLLAELYRDGKGVRADAKRAFELYRQAADLGSGEACWVLGQKCKNENPAEARALLHRAVSLGESRAQAELDSL
jgi:TPR repeat protein